MRDLLHDPLVVEIVDGEPVMLNDWRLEKLAKAADKSE